MWHRTFDSNNRPYYFNDNTNETTSEKPKELWTELDEALASADWFEYSTEDGKPYWYNKKSGTSVWEIPKEFKHFKSPASANDTSNSSGHTESFEDMAARLDLKVEFSQALPRFIKEEAFWAIDTASERRNAYKAYLKKLQQKELSSSLQQRKERSAMLLIQLQSTFGDKLVDWETAKERLDLKGTKEDCYAYCLWRDANEKERAEKRIAVGSKLSQALELTKIDTNTDWEALERLVRNITDDLHVLDEVISVKLDAGLESLDMRHKIQERKDRKARERFRAKLAELHEEGILRATSDWQTVLSAVPEDILMAVCHSRGSTATELFWDYVSQLKQKFNVQVGVVEDVLTKKNLSVSGLSLDEFQSLFEGDKRVQDTLDIYNYLKVDNFDSQRRDQRSLARGEGGKYHKPVLEY